MNLSLRRSPFCLAALTALILPDSHAFLLIRGTLWQKGARPVSAAPIWRNRKVVFRVNPNLGAYGTGVTLPAQTQIHSNIFLNLATQAVQAWADACKSNLEVTIEGTTSAVKDSSDGVSTISWDDRDVGTGNMFGDRTILGAATSVLAGNEYVECDIVINGDFNGVYGVGDSIPIGEFDLLSTLTHEVGHCLGLDHPVEENFYDSTNQVLRTATMVQTATAGGSSTFRRTLNQDDRDGVDCLYERGRGFRTGLSCGSYHGTNGGISIAQLYAQTGNILGGPSVDGPKVCGTESGANQIEPSAVDSGGGCILDAVAADGRRPPFSFSRLFGSAWGYLFVLLFGHLIRKSTTLLRGTT
jgi:hypothetical protein